jgi:hypothetical protein
MPPIYLTTHLPTHAHRCQCLTGIVKGQILALCKSEPALREFLEARAFEVDEEKREVCVCVCVCVCTYVSRRQHTSAYVST